MNKQKLKVGISAGDPNGIGIEVILKSLQNPKMLKLFNPVIFANTEIIEYQMKAFNINLELNSIKLLKKFVRIELMFTIFFLVTLNTFWGSHCPRRSSCFKITFSINKCFKFWGNRSPRYSSNKKKIFYQKSLILLAILNFFQTFSPRNLSCL